MRQLRDYLPLPPPLPPLPPLPPVVVPDLAMAVSSLIAPIPAGAVRFLADRYAAIVLWLYMYLMNQTRLLATGIVN